MACVQVIHSLGLQRIKTLFLKKEMHLGSRGELEDLKHIKELKGNNIFQLIPHQEPFAFASFHQVVDWDDAVAYINSLCIQIKKGTRK